MSEMANSSQNFIHPFLILAVAARSALSSSSRLSLYNKESLHVHTSLHPPVGPQLDQLLGLSRHIAYIWNRQLPATSHHVLHRLWIHLLHYVHWTEFTCTPFPQTPHDHFPEFPGFTFNLLSRRLVLHSATRLPSCSIVDAISTRSSAFRFRIHSNGTINAN